MADHEQRVRCRYCGSNNFTNTPTCWQCNRPLNPLVEQSVAPTVFDGAADAGSLPRSAVSFAPQIDTLAADRAAIALGLLFPIFGYPIGLAFLMLEDPRKVQLGKLAILWSTIGIVLSVVVSIVLAAPLIDIGKHFVPTDPLSHLSLPGDGSN